MALRIDKSIRAHWSGGRRRPEYVRGIVFHFTGNGGTAATAKGNANYFRDGCPERKADGSIALRPASAQYVVDQYDIAYECLPPDMIAYAVGDGTGGRYGKQYNNYNTVSIEMVSQTDAAGNYIIPIQTQRNAAELYRSLRKIFPNATAVLRHYDISGKLCPAPMIDEKIWTEFKETLREDYIDMTKDELTSVKGTGDKPSDWAKPATEWAKEQGLFGGDGNGNYGWQQPITREALAQVLYAAAQKK